MMTDREKGSRPPAVVHVDLDGLAEIGGTHGWDIGPDDPIFASGMRNALSLFDRFRIRATLFAVGRSLDDPAKRALLEEAVDRGHEIASHTDTHPHLLRIDRDRKRREIEASRRRLEDDLGVEVRGFRAPGYQIDRECMETLEEFGYLWDASAFPTRTFGSRLGVAVDALTRPGNPYEGLSLIELPLPDHRPSPVPFNPSYAHLFGTGYFSWGVGRAARQERPLVVLFHLIDVAAPLPAGRVRGWRGKLFTLSYQSEAAKIRRSERMLELVTSRFRITTTPALLDELGLEPRAAA